MDSAAVVLVVDDNDANRALFQTTLEDEGYRVVLAPNGVEGVAAFAGASPDCVLLDVRMPDLDGFEVCARIRALPGGAETPVIFVTAQRDLETFETALRAGGDDYLTKPVRPTELVLRVQAALRLRRISTERQDLYRLIRAQRDDLMRILLQKERLSAFLVHDLKNPIAGIIMGADLIARDSTASGRNRDVATRIRESAQGLSRLVGGLLDISRSDEGQLVPERNAIDLAALLDEVAEAQSMRAATARVVLTRSVETGEVYGDRSLLRRVLGNLLENAIRHAPRDSEVRLSARRVGDEVELCVADRGCGVPEDLRDRVFDRFVQGDQRHTRDGHGLGLAFCKMVVEAHGGRIWVENSSPGAVFTMRLPAADTQEMPDGPR